MSAKTWHVPMETGSVKAQDRRVGCATIRMWNGTRQQSRQSWKSNKSSITLWGTGESRDGADSHTNFQGVFSIDQSHEGLLTLHTPPLVHVHLYVHHKIQRNNVNVCIDSRVCGYDLTSSCSCHWKTSLCGYTLGPFFCYRILCVKHPGS